MFIYLSYPSVIAQRERPGAARKQRISTWQIGEVLAAGVQRLPNLVPKYLLRNNLAVL